MKKEKKIVISLSLLFIFINIIFYNIIETNKNQRIQLALQGHLEKLQTHYELFLYNQKNIANAVYERTVANKRVIEIISEASTSNTSQKALLRDELFNMQKPMYKKLTHMGVLQYHFLLANNESFLRMHKPKKFGDDLTNVREDVRYVNRTKKQVSGFVQGRIAHATRNIFALFDENKNHIGAVEISFSMQHLQNYLVNIAKLHTHFLVDKKYFNKKSNNKKEVPSKKELSLNYVQSHEHQNYLFLQRVEDEKEEYYFDDATKKEVDANLKKGEIFSIYYQNKNDSTDAVSFYPIKDIENKKTLAWLISFENDTFITMTLNSSFINKIIIFFGLLSLFYFIYKVLIQKEYLRKVVKTRTKELVTLNRSLEDKVSLQVNEINKTKNLLETILNTTTESIAILDLDTNFLFLNNAYEKMTGYAKEELSVLSLRDLMLPHYIQDLEDAIEIVKEKGFVINFEKSCLTKDADIIDVKINIILMPDKRRMLVTAHDITLQNKLKKENIIREHQLLEQSKLAQMGEMLNMIAHQWRQPLNSISASSIKLSLKNSLNLLEDNDIEEISSFIQNETQLLSTIIDDFMAFNKPEGNLKFFIKDTLENVSKMMLPQLKNRDITLEIDIDENMKIFHNPRNIEHVLVNIIINARDAFEDSKNTNKKIRVFSEIDEDSVILKIEDNAGGIPEDIIDKVFNPYFTTKEQGKGTGIGLYMSKKMVEDINGSIISVKVFDEHTIFSIRFKKQIDEV